MHLLLVLPCRQVVGTVPAWLNFYILYLKFYRNFLQEAVGPLPKDIAHWPFPVARKSWITLGLDAKEGCFILRKKLDQRGWTKVLWRLCALQCNYLQIILLLLFSCFTNAEEPCMWCSLHGAWSFMCYQYLLLLIHTFAFSEAYPARLWPGSALICDQKLGIGWTQRPSYPAHHSSLHTSSRNTLLLAGGCLLFMPFFPWKPIKSSFCSWELSVKTCNVFTFIFVLKSAMLRERPHAGLKAGLCYH